MSFEKCNFFKHFIFKYLLSQTFFIKEFQECQKEDDQQRNQREKMNPWKCKCETDFEFFKKVFKTADSGWKRFLWEPAEIKLPSIARRTRQGTRRAACTDLPSQERDKVDRNLQLSFHSLALFGKRLYAFSVWTPIESRRNHKRRYTGKQTFDRLRRAWNRLPLRVSKNKKRVDEKLCVSE